MLPYEYEIKLLGSRKNLEKVASKILALSQCTAPARSYKFSTIYYDAFILEDEPIMKTYESKATRLQKLLPQALTA